MCPEGGVEPALLWGGFRSEGGVMFCFHSGNELGGIQSSDPVLVG